MKTLILLAFMLIANVFGSELQEMACDDKSLSYCINHYDRQCDAKNYSACFIVGQLHFKQKQYSKVKKYSEIVCDRANSKDSFVVELIDGSMGPKVPIIGGIKASCGILGNLYYDGKGVRQSYEKALHYEKKACDLGNGVSCYFAGAAYFEGEGVQKNLKSAIAFYAKSCKLEYGSGCAAVGLFYRGGIVVKKNLSTAKELFGKACDLGNQNGCDDYKELKEEGY